MINDQMQNIINKFNVMAHPQDLSLQILLINYIKPKKILEMGTGSGAWAMAVNELCDIDMRFVLIENFRYINKGFSPSYLWPKDRNELIEHIVTTSKKEIDFEVLDIDAAYTHNLNLTDVSLIRWDCDIPNPKENISKIIDNTPDNLILIVDDIRPNYCFHRLLTMIDLVRENKISLLWLGIEESAWVKPNVDKNKILNHLENYSDNFTFFQRGTNPFITESIWEYIRTQDLEFSKLFK
jgi:hypothetical protein